MSLAIAIAAGGLLAIAPGAWLAFTLVDRDAGPGVRLALSVALSPFVVGLQILILTRLGLDFDAASAATLLNVAALVLVWRGRQPHAAGQGGLLAPIAAILPIAAGIVVLWMIAPEFRIYSWHNMMQAEAVYQVAGLPRAPEEMALAGVPLAYNWFGHIQIAAIGRLADASPFLVFPVVNILTLVAMFWLLWAAVRAMRPGNAAAAAFVTAAALMSTNLAGVLLVYVTGPDAIGDHRVVTLVQKFLHFDLMTNGEALLAAVIVLGLRLGVRFSWATWLAIWLGTVATGFTYSLLFPAAVVLSGFLIAAPVARDLVVERRLAIPGRTWIVGASLIVAGLIFIGQMKMLSLGGAGGRVALSSPGEAVYGVKIALKAYLVWLPFLAVAAWRLMRNPEPYRLALLASAAVLAGLSVAVQLPVATQYKFLVASLFCSLPLVCEQALVWLSRTGRSAQPVAAAAALAVLVLATPYCVRALVPWTQLDDAVSIEDDHFTVAAAGAAQLDWVRAVRDLTPAGTIVVAPPSAIPVTVLTGRPEFMSRDPEGGSRPGYSMPSAQILEEVKAQPRDLVGQRDLLSRAVYAEPVAAPATLDAETITEGLQSLGRPVAVYLPIGSAYLAWLHGHAVGRGIFADGDGEVILLEPAGS